MKDKFFNNITDKVFCWLNIHEYVPYDRYEKVLYSKKVGVCGKITKKEIYEKCRCSCCEKCKDILLETETIELNIPC